MGLIHRKTPYQYAADTVRSFRVLVLPRSLVTRGGRQDLDVVAETQLLGEQPAGVLRAAGDLTTVARCHERKLHAIAPCLCGADRPFPRPSASTTGPDGNSSSTWAAGRSDRSLRANHPGIRSMRCVGGLDDRNANMSRYFLSITGQL